MSDFTTVDEILDYAIGMEQAAVDLYTRIAEQTANPTARKVFLGFAGEEKGHKAKLEAVKAGKKFVGSAKAVQDLKIADYMDDPVHVFNRLCVERGSRCGMYLDTDEKHSGTFPLPFIGDVPFEVELKTSDNWNYTVGAGYELSDRVNLSLEAGFGNRQHSLFNFNVRF